MHPDNQKQFEINMDTVARFAGFRPQEDIKMIVCKDCKEECLPEDYNDEYKCCRECYMELADEHNVPPFEGMDAGDSYGDR